jgi:Flp pilus assembly protein TadG
MSSQRPANRTWFGALRSSLGRFARDRVGASALEFAIVALPFLLLTLGIFEVGLVYFATLELDNAIAHGSRFIRTGQAQSANMDAAQFKDEVCKHLIGLIDCNGLKLDVRSFSDFSSAQLTQPLDGAGNMKQTLTFDPGNPGDIVVVRAFYEWELAAKLPKEVSLSNMSNGNRLLVSTASFRNEPFTQNGGAGAGAGAGS